MSSKTNNSGASSTSRMTSIARRINMEFWLREFCHLLILDLVLVVLAMATFFLWREGLVPDGLEVTDRYFEGSDRYETWRYVIETESGMKYGCFMSQVLTPCKIPAIVLGIVEGLFLFGNLFSTGMVRKKMKPLNEIAIRMEALSNLPVSATGGVAAGKVAAGKASPGEVATGKAATDKAAAAGQRSGGDARHAAGASGQKVNLKNMEKAISRLNPVEPGARLVTGDKELQSLEIAINNLLDRMRESNRQQERFVSDASHELRTPIAVIQGYVNMLDRWGKDDEQILKESIEALKNESEHMKNLVEQLLFLARGDSGRNALHMEQFDLTEMVRDVMEESAMIDEKHVYRFEPSGGIDASGSVTVTGDLSMLKQALRIFVQNASKYSNEGDTITLRAGMDKDDRPFYSVQDEGVGMQSSEVVHVFERFYRSDSARNSAQGGTGLGLSIAKWIVDAHEGTIEILSRPEFGSRITVRL